MTTPILRIRRATTIDAKLLAEIGAETFSDTFAKDNASEDMTDYLAKSFGEEIQAKELADPGNIFLIAECENETAGYARLHFGEAPVCVLGNRPMEVARFYSRKPWIGKGIGQELMKASLMEAERAGCDAVWLDVWERNPRAIAFYRKWGFLKVGEQIFLLGSDRQRDWIMAKMLQ